MLNSSVPSNKSFDEYLSVDGTVTSSKTLGDCTELSNNFLGDGTVAFVNCNLGWTIFMLDSNSLVGILFHS